MKKIFTFMLILLVIFTIASVSAAEDNLTEEITLEEETILTENEEGYVDATEAYEALNEFRTEDGVWYWQADDTHIIYYNTNESNKLKPLEKDNELENVAKIRAKELTELFEHERPDGTICFSIYPDYFSLGENIAIADSGREATEAWKEDFLPFAEQGHRHNMLNPGFNCVGIAGYRDSTGMTYWVQAFGYKFIQTNQTVIKPQKDETKATFADLNNLILENDILELTTDYKFFNDTEITINKSVTIDGKNHVIDAAKSSRIFNIFSGKVILKNIRFENGYVDYADGGAILSENADLTIINCTFNNNFAYHGSAVASQNSLKLINSTFKDNWGVEAAVYAISKISAENTKFIDNKAILYAAALYLNSADAQIAGTVFDKNTAGLEAGAIYSLNSNISNVNVTFIKNGACLKGGALVLINSKLSDIDSDFTENNLTSKFYSLGAGIYGENSEVSLTDSRFIKNSLDAFYNAANGGAIYLMDSKASIANSEFIENSAIVYGSAICLVNTPTNITNSKFTKNHYNEGRFFSMGGAIYSEDADLKISDSEFTDSSAFNGAAIALKNNNVKIKNCEFINNSAVYNGAGIYGEDVNISITDAVFKKGSAAFNGGAFRFENSNITVKKTVFDENSAEYGGAVELSNSRINISDSTFTNHILIAENACDGGAIYLRAGEISLTNSTVTDAGISSKNYFSRGGAVFVEDADVYITDSKFENTFSDNGAALYLNRVNAIISNAVITNASANSYGVIYLTNANASLSGVVLTDSKTSYSAVYVYNSGFNLTDSIISDISAQFDGGAIGSETSDITIVGSIFTNINLNHENHNNGGALFLNNGNLTIADSVFRNTSASNFGGAVYLNNSKSLIHNTTFTDSSIDSTGYYAFGGAFYTINGETSVTDSKFIDCSVSATYASQGGAVFLRDVDAVISNNEFINNAAVRGAAIYIWNSNASIVDSEFKNNSATFTGGAVSIDTSNADITASRFTKNTAPYGGSVYAGQSNSTVKKSVFTDSSAESGGAVYAEESQFTILSSEFRNNSASWDGGAVYGANVSDSLFLNNCANDAGAIYGNKNTAVNCTFENNTAYNNNPTFNVKCKDCTLKNNRQIQKVMIYTNYVADEFFEGDILYIPVYTYDYNLVENATLTIKINGKTFTFQSTSGWNINISEGVYNAQLSIESSEFEAEPVNITISVLKRETSNVEVFLNNHTYGEDTCIELKSNVDGQIELGIDDTYFNYFTVFADSLSYDRFTNLNAGTHIIKVRFTPNDVKFQTVNIEKEFTVYKKDTYINMGVETDNPVTLSVKTSDNGIVEIRFEDTSRTVEVNGFSKIDLGNLNPGTYTVVALFTVDDNHETSNASATFTVYAKITQENVKVDLNHENMEIILPGDAEGNITVTVNGENYIFPVVNGNADVKLPEGEYSYTIAYSGDGKYSAFAMSCNVDTVNSVSSINPEVEITEITKITLPSDAKGTLTLKVNGENYTFDVINGVANIEIPDLKNGNYEYTIVYSGDGKYSSFSKKNTLTVDNPVEIIASNAKVIYSAGSLYKITVKDYGKVKVSVKINGKAFKTLTTDSNGACSFKVTQNPGTYKVQIQALGYTLTKTLNVKHIVTLKKVTVKKSAKKLTLQASLSKVNKKYLKNKKITFKFNGKKYTAKTNAKGVAKVTIKKAVLKKLKVGKKLTYSATFLKDTVKVTVKVKK